MEKYNYNENVKNDVKNWIVNNWGYIEEKFQNEEITNYDELYEYLNDTLWAEDSVTGNGSGSYTFNTWQAEENLCHNTDLLGEALQEFGCDSSYLEKGAEACDVTIRCYLLGGAISEVLEGLEDLEGNALLKALDEITEE